VRPRGCGYRLHEVALLLGHADLDGQPEAAELGGLQGVVVREDTGGQQVRDVPRLHRRQVALEQAGREHLGLVDRLAPHVGHEQRLVVMLTGQLGDLDQRGRRELAELRVDRAERGVLVDDDPSAASAINVPPLIA
jgi:hypothetical protein